MDGRVAEMWNSGCDLVDAIDEALFIDEFVEIWGGFSFVFLVNFCRRGIWVNFFCYIERFG